LKKISLVAIAVALAGVSAAHAAGPSLNGSSAGGSGGLVMLNIDANCEITADITSGIDLGAVVPSTIPFGDAVNDITAKVRCTNTTPFAISVARSPNLSSGANTIPYSFNFKSGVIVGANVPATAPAIPPGPGAPSGSFNFLTGLGVGSGFASASNDISIGFTAKVLIADYQNAAPGSYSDATLVMTVTW